jgi:hypothetical protein
MPQPQQDKSSPPKAQEKAQALRPSAFRRLWSISAGPIWQILKYVLAALYFILDETGRHVKRLAIRFKPLRWYFGLIRLVRYHLTRHGLRSQTQFVRTATPFATLPFILVPGLALIPLKLLLVAYILTKPLLGVAGIIAAKFFSAIFVKNTWDILRPVARRNPWIAWLDDYWQRLEGWAKNLMRDLKHRITQTHAFRLMANRARALKNWLKFNTRHFTRRARLIAGSLIARLTQRGNAP